jgi:erythritol transport system permease protein
MTRNTGDLILPADATAGRSRPGRPGGRVDVGRMLLEGRAFFALIAIIVVFSALSP